MKDDCVFCAIVAGRVPARVLLETEHACAFLDAGPAADFHALVVPRAHYRDLFAIPRDVLGHTMDAAKTLADEMRRRFGIEHVQLFQSSGAEAQQEVFHFHVHLVPRRAGDGQDVRWRSDPARVRNLDRTLERWRAVRRRGDASS